MNPVVNFVRVYAKAFVAFAVTYIGSLIGLVQSNVPLDAKAFLLALGISIVTTYGVYQTPNKAK